MALRSISEIIELLEARDPDRLNVLRAEAPDNLLLQGGEIAGAARTAERIVGEVSLAGLQTFDKTAEEFRLRLRRRLKLARLIGLFGDIAAVAAPATIFTLLGKEQPAFLMIAAGISLAGVVAGLVAKYAQGDPVGDQPLSGWYTALGKDMAAAPKLRAELEACLSEDKPEPKKLETLADRANSMLAVLNEVRTFFRA